MEIEDAAAIDGCNKFGTLVRVIIPLSIPRIIASGMLYFLNDWNDFLFALIFLFTANLKTQPVAITELST